MSVFLRLPYHGIRLGEVLLKAHGAAWDGTDLRLNAHYWPFSAGRHYGLFWSTQCIRLVSLDAIDWSDPMQMGGQIHAITQTAALGQQPPNPPTDHPHQEPRRQTPRPEATAGNSRQLRRFRIESPQLSNSGQSRTHLPAIDEDTNIHRDRHRRRHRPARSTPTTTGTDGTGDSLQPTTGRAGFWTDTPRHRALTIEHPVITRRLSFRP